MTKPIISYILAAACLLTACATDVYEPENPTPGRDDELTLTVSASEVVVSDGIPSRAIDTSAATQFKVGDRLGLSVVGSKGQLMANNVPYRYNGKTWEFDSLDANGKRRVYYDADMRTYNVYFPYTKDADGITDINDVKELDVFKHKTNQNKEADFLQSANPLIWSLTDEKATRTLKVDLSHARNTFTLVTKVRWELCPTGETIEYRPVDTAMVDFKIKDDKEFVFKALPFEGKKGIDSTYYNETNCSYNYVLPDGYVGTISWEYTYRELIFQGTFTVTSQDHGTRFIQGKIEDMGKLENFYVLESDYYCANAKGTGYVFPWDAEPCFLDKDGQLRRFVGIVTYVGHNREDISSYDKSVFPTGRCDGYVVALSDAHSEPVSWSSIDWAKKMGTRSKPVDWSGYNNHQILNDSVKDKDIDYFKANLPAVYYCGVYGGSTEPGKISFEAPANTSGWFLPSSETFEYVMKKDKIDLLDDRFETIRNAVKKYNVQYVDSIKMYNTIQSYWGSNEHLSYNNQAYHTHPAGGNSSTSGLKTDKHNVRAFLTF